MFYWPKGKRYKSFNQKVTKYVNIYLRGTYVRLLTFETLIIGFLITRPGGTDKEMMMIKGDNDTRGSIMSNQCKK